MSQTALQFPKVKSVDFNDSGLQLILSPSKDAKSAQTAIRRIWWSNAIFFITFHVVGLSAMYYWPSSWRTWFLCYINWQVGMLGITMGKQNQFL